MQAQDKQLKTVRLHGRRAPLLAFDQSLLLHILRMILVLATATRSALVTLRDHQDILKINFDHLQLLQTQPRIDHPLHLAFELNSHKWAFTIKTQSPSVHHLA